jgi:hypothetical protein
MADTKNEKSDTVLVPPAGVHTPGRTAMGDESPYVEAPADAASDPDAAREAYEKAQRGDYDETLPAGVIPQNADGSAKTPAEAAETVEDERRMKDHIEGKADQPSAAKHKG